MIGRFTYTNRASIMTLSYFINKTHISGSLVRAVVKQLGGWESFKESAPDIARHSINGGFHGFIYHADTLPFARRNRTAIVELLNEQANELGENVQTMIESFGIFRRSPADTGDKLAIAQYLYGGRVSEGNGTQVLNLMAWFAAEEVARAYDDVKGGE